MNFPTVRSEIGNSCEMKSTSVSSTASTSRGLFSEPGGSIAPLAPLFPGTCPGQYSKLSRRTPQEVARRAHPGIRPRPHRARGGATLLAAPGSGAGKLRGGTLYPRYFSCGVDRGSHEKGRGDGQDPVGSRREPRGCGARGRLDVDGAENLAFYLEERGVV